MKNGSCSTCGHVGKRFLNVDEAAAYLGLTSSALRTMIARRQIDFLKLGSRIRFDVTTLDKCLIPYPGIDSV